MITIRSILFNLLFYLNLVLLLIAAIPTLVLPRRAILGMAKLWGRTSLWLLRVICGIDVEWRGLEKIPPGGIVVAAKHQSVWETFALITLFPDPAFIIKRELLWIPFFGWYAWHGGMIPVDRGAGKAALSGMTVHARKALAEGRQIIIFQRARAGRPARNRNTSSGSSTFMRKPAFPACRSRSIRACSGRAAASCVFLGRCGWRFLTRFRRVATGIWSLPSFRMISRPQPRA